MPARHTPKTLNPYRFFGSTRHGAGTPRGGAISGLSCRNEGRRSWAIRRSGERSRARQPSRSEHSGTLQHSSEIGSSRRLRSSPRSQAPSFHFCSFFVCFVSETQSTISAVAVALATLRPIAKCGMQMRDVDSRNGRISARPYCALMPASPITFPHFAISVRKREAQSSGVLATGS